MSAEPVPSQDAHDPGRDDYAGLVHFRALAPGEPYFMIRGQDAVSGAAVRAWAQLARDAGAPAAVVEQALRQADRLDAWPAKKVADDGHVPEAERQQLAYALERRAWAARDQAGDIRVMLAQERALSQARGYLRPVLRELFSRGSWQANGAFVFQPPPDPAEGPTPPNAVLKLQRLELDLRGEPLRHPVASLAATLAAEASEALAIASADETPDEFARGRAEALVHAAELVTQLAERL